MSHQHHHHPKRSLGQNFLVDGNLQRKIVAALEAGPDDEVLEVGPGKGALTQHLAHNVGRLILVELDDALARSLVERYGGKSNIEIVNDDVLHVETASLSRDPTRMLVLGNIPYNITTPILFHLLQRPRPAKLVIMVQKEVAHRITAPPGDGEYGALSVGVQSVAAVERLFDVSRNAFRPIPNVDSTVIKITPHAPPLRTPEQETRLRSLTRAAFQWRRKQIQKVLRDHPDLAVPDDRLAKLEKDTGFDLTRRPETFSPEELLRLSEVLPLS
jgi:16S rRNA (adenine1518-N6/adenine1519-N6)-dimethyltransferase